MSLVWLTQIILTSDWLTLIILTSDWLSGTLRLGGAVGVALLAGQLPWAWLCTQQQMG